MDEILKAKRLREEILKRAESIRLHMEEVNSSMAKIELMERTSVGQALHTNHPRLGLLDLPDDCIGYIMSNLEYTSMCCLAQTCIRLQNLVYTDHQGWEVRCRADWGILERHPDQVAKLETCLAISQPPAPTPMAATASLTSPRTSSHDCPQPMDGVTFDDIVSPRRSSGGGAGPAGLASPRRHTGDVTPRNSPSRAGLSPHSPGVASIPLEPACLFSLSDRQSPGLLSSPSRLSSARAGGRRSIPGAAARASLPGHSEPRDSEAGEVVPGAGSLWRLIYRDRTQGWQLVVSLLDWLRTHGSPRGVSGSMHRLQLLLALRYMALGTGHPHDAPRKMEVINLDGLKSLLALLENDSAQVVEGALHVLANLIQGDSNNKVLLLIGSRMGKMFADKLDMEGDILGVVQQACRALVTLWADKPAHEVCVLDQYNQPAVPELLPGVWNLQEYTLRGECLPLIKLCLKFVPERQGSVVFTGAGLRDPGSEEDDQDFHILGFVDVNKRTWFWQRRTENIQRAISYRGYSEAQGSYGMFASMRAGGSAASFMISSSRQPRVYRLYRDTCEPATADPSVTHEDSRHDRMQE